MILRSLENKDTSLNRTIDFLQTHKLSWLGRKTSCTGGGFVAKVFLRDQISTLLENLNGVLAKFWGPNQYSLLRLVQPLPLFAKGAIIHSFLCCSLALICPFFSSPPPSTLSGLSSGTGLQVGIWRNKGPFLLFWISGFIWISREGVGVGLLSP